MRNYKILTKTTNEEMLKQLDNGDKYADMDLLNEQEEELKSNCLEEGFNTPILTLFEAHNGIERVCYYEDIVKAIEELLNTKEGADLVEFDSGRIGFIGYYGQDLTYFEIIRQATDFDRDFIDSFEFYPTIEEYNQKAKHLTI